MADKCEFSKEDLEKLTEYLVSFKTSLMDKRFVSASYDVDRITDLIRNVIKRCES